MFDKIQVSLVKLLAKFMEIEKSFWEASSREKRDPFQITIIPPEAPTEGRNSNLLNFFGPTFSDTPS
jgi:hypothetical protein